MKADVWQALQEIRSELAALENPVYINPLPVKT